MLMSAMIIWLDSRSAKLFELDKSGVQEKVLHTHGHSHPSQPHGHHSGGGHHPEADVLFKDLTHAIGGATEILVVGPGETKTHFKTYLEKHSRTLADKVVGVQTVDHPTDNQILELGRKFFKSYDLFHG